MLALFDRLSCQVIRVTAGNHPSIDRTRRTAPQTGDTHVTIRDRAKPHDSPLQLYSPPPSHRSRRYLHRITYWFIMRKHTNDWREAGRDADAGGLRDRSTDHREGYGGTITHNPCQIHLKLESYSLPENNRARKEARLHRQATRRLAFRVVCRTSSTMCQQYLRHHKDGRTR